MSDRCPVCAVLSRQLTAVETALGPWSMSLMEPLETTVRFLRKLAEEENTGKRGVLLAQRARQLVRYRALQERVRVQVGSSVRQLALPFGE